MDLGRLLGSRLAGLILRPAFDRLAVPAIARLYFPLSRAWAAALEAEGDVARLIAAVPELAARPQVARRALKRLAPRSAEFKAASELWDIAFFGPDAVDQPTLRAVEARRVEAAESLMLGRLLFLDGHLRAGHAPIGWTMEAQEAVTKRHGERLGHPDKAFPLPDPLTGALHAAELSRSVERDGYCTQWLRMPSDVGGTPDTLWARIDRPAGDGPHPVLVFTHGICMETDFFRETSGPAQDLARAGLVVIRPEGPYHSRRRVPGRFGGEPVFALGPMGLLNYFEAHVRELGVLTAWARQTYGGPVAVGGVSLGALTAQLVATAAVAWPVAARPDALLLVTCSGSIMEVVMSGSLPGALGVPPELAAQGWLKEDLEAWMALLEPGDTPVLPGERIVVLLGQRDTITPYAEGRRLVERWRVPQDNLFLHDLGHFTASLTLYRDPAPFERLRAVLDAAA